MKRLIPIISAFALVISLSGCELLLGQKNLFSGFEADPSEKYEGMTPSETLDALERDSASPTFYDNLADDPALTAEIIDNLDQIISDPDASDSDVISAALFKSDIILNTSDAGDVVNALADGLLDMGDTSTEADIISAFLDPIATVIDDPVSFTAFIDSMLDLAVTYDALAAAGPTSLDGDVAQAAVVSLLLRAVVYSIDAPTPEDQVEALRTALLELSDDDPMTEGNLTFAGTADPFTDMVAEGRSLLIILEAAGMGDISDMFRDMGEE